VSLINDALRKARQAAAEHEMHQPEAPFRTPKAYPSRGPRRRSAVMLLVVVAATAGLAGAGLVWWTLGRGDAAVAVGDRSVADPAPETATISQSESAEEPIEKPPADSGDATDTRDVRDEGTEPSGGERATGQMAGTASDSERQTLAARPTAPPGRAEEPIARQDSAGGRRVFVLDADLGYASLSLGFIVARSVRPFAEVNDIEVYVGSEVAGFVVEKIEPDQVTLRDARGELVLKVR
jgi:hypothetical protein